MLDPRVPVIVEPNVVGIGGTKVKFVAVPPAEVHPVENLQDPETIDPILL